MKLFADHTASLPTFLRRAAAGFDDENYRYSIPFMSPAFAIIIIRREPRRAHSTDGD